MLQWNSILQEMFTRCHRLQWQGQPTQKLRQKIVKSGDVNKLEQRCIFQKGNLFLEGFEGPFPVWTEDRAKAKSYPKKYDYDIVRSCYKADPDSDLITSEVVDS